MRERNQQEEDIPPGDWVISETPHVPPRTATAGDHPGWGESGSLAALMGCSNENKPPDVVPHVPIWGCWRNQSFYLLKKEAMSVNKWSIFAMGSSDAQQAGQS